MYTAQDQPPGKATRVSLKLNYNQINDVRPILNVQTNIIRKSQ
jgi:hypothetical protein